MRITRHKYDSKKPFVVIKSKKEFDRIEATEEVYPNYLILPVDVKAQKDSLSILIPPIKTYPPLTASKKEAKITPNYIRVTPSLNLPNSKDYELTELDLLFIQKHRLSFAYDGKQMLTPEFFKEAIIFLQAKCQKIGTQKQWKHWIKLFQEEKSRKMELSDEKNKLQSLIFDYWANRRKQFRSPLYRYHWKTCPNLPILYETFRVRQTIKSTSRKNKKLQQKMLIQLEGQLEMVSSICSKIYQRELVKFQQIQLNSKQFCELTCKLLENDSQMNKLMGLEQQKQVENEPQRDFFEISESEQSTKTLIQANVLDNVRLEELEFSNSEEREKQSSTKKMLCSQTRDDMNKKLTFREKNEDFHEKAQRKQERVHDYEGSTNGSIKDQKKLSYRQYNSFHLQQRTVSKRMLQFDKKDKDNKVN